MKDDAILQAPNTVTEPLPWQTIQPHRIQAVDDEAGLRERSGKMLIDAGHYAAAAKNVRRGAISMMMLQLSLPALVHAQEIPAAPTGLRVLSSDSSAGSNSGVIPAQNAIHPNAVAVSIHGNCECSEDGSTFTSLERGRVL